MGCRVILVITILVFACVAFPEEESADSPTVAFEFLNSLSEVTGDYHATTAYLGNNHAFEAIQVKLEKILELTESTELESLPPDLVQALFFARSFDLFALAIADSQRAPISGEKLYPIPQLADLSRRHLSLYSDEIAKENFMERMRSFSGGGVFAWKTYGQGRTTMNPKAAWEYTLRESLNAHPELEPFLLEPQKTNPFQLFHNRAVGIPSVSDDFLHTWKNAFHQEGKNLGKLSEGPIKVRFEEITGTTLIKFQIEQDGLLPIHIKIEADDGSLGINLGAIHAVDWEEGEEPISNGDIHLPASLHDENHVLFVTRIDLSPFEKFTKPSSGNLLIWAEEQTDLELLNSREPDFLFSGR